MTNGDKIREMKNDELAFWIMCPLDLDKGLCEQVVCRCLYPEETLGPKDCYSCIKDWLNKEN